MTVDHADDADDGRIHLVVDRVREPTEQDAAQLAAHHRKALRCFRNVAQRDVDLGQEVGRRILGSREIPLECFRDLSSGASPDAEHGHSANPGAELVSEGSPRNTCVGISIRFRLAAIELRGERG